MKRWVRSALAVLIGFLATSAAFAAIEAQNGRAEQVDPTLLGTVNTFDYCRDEFGNASAAVLVGDGAWAWRCVFTSNNVFQEERIDFDAACRTQHASNDAYASAWDASNPYSWQCFVEG